MAFALNAEQEHKLEDILSRYPNKMAACIPALHLCQEANENWVSEDIIALSCALRGAEDLVKHCEKRLGIHVGETTKDGRITLRTAECLAACGTAPVMQVDKRYHENLTTQEVDRILDRLIAG